MSQILSVQAGSEFQPSVRFLKIQQVIELAQLCRTSVHTIPDFPKPVKLGSSMQSGARWVEHEVVAWMQARMAARTKADRLASIK